MSYYGGWPTGLKPTKKDTWGVYSTKRRAWLDRYKMKCYYEARKAAATTDEEIQKWNDNIKREEFAMRRILEQYNIYSGRNYTTLLNHRKPRTRKVKRAELDASGDNYVNPDTNKYILTSNGRLLRKAKRSGEAADKALNRIRRPTRRHQYKPANRGIYDVANGPVLADDTDDEDYNPNSRRSAVDDEDPPTEDEDGPVRVARRKASSKSALRAKLRARKLQRGNHVAKANKRITRSQLRGTNINKRTKEQAINSLKRHAAAVVAPAKKRRSSSQKWANLTNTHNLRKRG